MQLEPVATVWRLSGAQGDGMASRGSGREASDPVERNRLRVLIVEDEALIALNMEAALLRAGLDVVGVADTEEEAILAVGRLQPDVVLMDIKLREGDGISAAKRIRANDGAPQVIFVSGNSDPSTLAAAGPAPFIRKPFLSGQLAGLLLRALGRSH